MALTPFPSCASSDLQHKEKALAETAALLESTRVAGSGADKRYLF